MKRMIVAFALLLCCVGTASAASVGTVVNETNAKNAKITSGGADVSILKELVNVKAAGKQDVGVVETGGSANVETIVNKTDASGAVITNAGGGDQRVGGVYAK